MEQDTKEDVLVNIREVFESDNCSSDNKLQALQKMKSILKPPDKTYSKLRLESLLQNAGFTLERNMPDKDCLFDYGIALANFVGRESGLDEQLLHQLEFALAELKKLDESKADAVCTLLWKQMEVNFVVRSSGALSASRQTVERIVLDWVDTTGDPELEFPARLAAASPQLFGILTKILYEVLLRLKGHEKVLKVSELFTKTVMSICRKEGKDFLGLYPKDCRSLVTLLMVSPDVFCLEENKLNHVYSMLYEVFSRDRSKCMILLSQYPAWMQPFEQYLMKTGDKMKNVQTLPKKNLHKNQITTNLLKQVFNLQKQSSE